ncbi:MAG: Xaa-Pro peptidase family protein [Christensenellaceae bacterium]|jgi:Xaa-Pro aminopeptidase|nr:Xaa-Pro peptidase family protein [Christensenellaceae bacterium]
MKKMFFRNTDAVIITEKSNLYYFSCFNNDDATIVFTKDKNYYITDSRNMEGAKEIVKGFELINNGPSTYLETAIKLCNDSNVNIIGYEDEQIKHKDYAALENALPGKQFIPMSDRIAQMRQSKDERELSYITKAQEITDLVFKEILDYIKPGMTELQVASQINSRIYGYGCTLAFDPIVSFGRNTSKPHSAPSTNVLDKIDIILLDFGAKYMGYCSDMSRSFAIGKVDSEYKRVYEHVLAGQNAVLSGLRADIKGCDCDAIARNYFQRVGLDEYFLHGLGHGVGIDIHEAPSLSRSSQDQICAGAVVTIEPGLYFNGHFGIRVEDMVRFENNAVYNLTKSPKTLIIL